MEGFVIEGCVINTQFAVKKLQEVNCVNVGGGVGYVMGSVACRGFVVADLGEDCCYLTVIKEFKVIVEYAPPPPPPPLSSMPIL